jgi:hypothetical protein
MLLKNKKGHDMIRYPFEKCALKGVFTNDDLLEATGLPSSFIPIFYEKSTGWTEKFTEEFFDKVVQIGTPDDLVRLVDDSITLWFSNKKRFLIATTRWIDRLMEDQHRHAVSDKTMQRWIKGALQAGNTSVLKALGIQDKQLPPDVSYLFPAIISKNPEVLAFFPNHRKWPNDIQHAAASMALYSASEHSGLKNVYEMLVLFLYPKMDVSLLKARHIESKPIVKAILHHRLVPPPEELRATSSTHRKLFYYAGLVGDKDANITSAIKKRHLSKDLGI